MAETRDLSSVIQIDGTSYNVHAKTAESADIANQVENKLIISVKQGAAEATTIAEFDGSESKTATITIPTIPTDTNQKVKANGVTFGANDVVEFVAGGPNVTITGDAEAKTITISSDSGGGSTLEVDSNLSDSSTNPVQNKVINNALESKVDKVSGKDLSTNDYTTEEQQKLAGIAAGAEVNVQSDWNVADDSSDAFIKNKPAIPTVNNATLTIQKNGIAVATFTANSADNVTANITVPTKTSELNNDSGFKKITVSTAEPTGGATGDIWFKYY